MKSHIVLLILTSSPPTASSFLVFALGLELPSWKDSSLFHPIGDLNTIFRQQNKRCGCERKASWVKKCALERNLDYLNISTKIFTIIKERNTRAENESNRRRHRVLTTNEEQEAEQEDVKKLAGKENQWSDDSVCCSATGGSECDGWKASENTQACTPPPFHNCVAR